MKNKHQIGTALVADFVTAITNLSTTATAQFMAEQSERATIQTIESMGVGGYVQANDMPTVSQQEMVKSSLDAHVKKAQADQIATFTAIQLQQMENQDKRYRGKKITVNIIDPDFSPVESYWLDVNTGEYSTGILKSRQVKGVIEDIVLSKNIIILKPTMLSKLLFPSRKYFAVYVINPETLQPAISLEI